MAGLLVGLICYPFFIPGNDSMNNVFKYPAIKTMLGADGSPSQSRTSCTITLWWSILESNTQSWYVEYSVYDVRQIDKNTYAAATCNPLPANYAGFSPADANYCEICGVNQRKKS